MKEQKTYWLTIGSAIQVGCMVLVIVLLTMLGSFAANRCAGGRGGDTGQYGSRMRVPVLAAQAKRAL